MEAARVKDENAALGKTDESDAETAVQTKTSSRLEGTLVCTRTGETLFDAISEDSNPHVEWLKSIEQQALQMGEIFPLGGFDRLESELTDGRVIALSRANKLIYVRVSTTLGGK